MSAPDDMAKFREAIERLLTDAQALEGAVAQAVGRSGAAGYGATPAVATAAAAVPTLNDSQHLICERIINVFETGSIRGRYGAISIFHDGPHGIRQITYGRAQTTEYGNLPKLVQMYVDSGGRFSEDLRPFVPLVGRSALVDNAHFKDLLKSAGNTDPVMQQTQDAFFDEVYFQPALDWAGDNGFTLALSILVIYDSFIHSGGILQFLRARFAERPPAAGGDEKTWIKAYVTVRNDWLATHSNPDLRPTVYRTKDLLREIGKGNWDLSVLPIMANGTPVDDRVAGGGMAALVIGAQDEIPYPPPLAAAVFGVDAEEVWSEVEPPGAAAGVAGGASGLAGQILADPRIRLATSHVSGNVDQATVRQNIVDTAQGLPAKRSSYDGAPGGTVYLDPHMLNGLLTLVQRYTFSVSEIAGGKHSPNSRHYAGIAADIGVINGRAVSAGHPDVPAFRAMCVSLGATEVRGPGDRNHSTHIHAAWPRQ